MALSQMTNADTSKFFKGVLGIPFDAARKDISTRAFNQYQQLSDAYVKTGCSQWNARWRRPRRSR
jgi:hypothetical protein